MTRRNNHTKRQNRTNQDKRYEETPTNWYREPRKHHGRRHTTADAPRLARSAPVAPPTGDDAVHLLKGGLQHPAGLLVVVGVRAVRRHRARFVSTPRRRAAVHHGRRRRRPRCYGCTRAEKRTAGLVGQVRCRSAGGNVHTTITETLRIAPVKPDVIDGRYLY